MNFRLNLFIQRGCMNKCQGYGINCRRYSDMSKEEEVLEIQLPITKVNYSANLSFNMNFPRRLGVNPSFLSKPFYKVENDTETVKLFFDAIVKRDMEGARRYISKNFVDVIDLAALEEIIGNKKICKYTAKAEFDERRTSFRTNSLVLFENGCSNLMHVHLIREPDNLINWKIFGIEKE